MQPTINKGDLVQVCTTRPSNLPAWGSEINGTIGIVTEIAQAGSSQYIEFVDGTGQRYALSSTQLKKI